MPTNRTTYRYNLKEGHKIIHTGITNNLERREQEHQQKYGDKVHIKQVGVRTTKEAALEWEEEQRQQGKPTGP